MAEIATINNHKPIESREEAFPLGFQYACEISTCYFVEMAYMDMSVSKIAEVEGMTQAVFATARSSLAKYFRIGFQQGAKT